MKISTGMIGKVVFSLLLAVSVVMTSLNSQIIAQSKTSSPTQITNPEKTVVLTKLNNNVWAHTSFNDWNGTTYDHNGLVISTSKGLVLIDTAWGDDQKTEELLRLSEKHLKKKVVLALITHAHDDSISGIRALLNQGIDVRSTRLTAKLAKEYGYPSPNPALDARPVMKVGNTVIEAFYPGEGHSKDNITVWLPQSQLLFGGCFIKSLEAKDLGNLSDANVEQWDDSVQQVIDKYPNVKTVVPGHGNWGDRSLLFHTLDLIKQHT
ncbi:MULTISPECIES: subclass B1 metallo-beta-lactamase [Bacillus]|uniref:beta-lactamase n=1 Tax=Bacillus glycinifermentans TaxID=1664069 RepID=A0AAJ4D2J3_9BACI|nr:MULTISPECIES: subclass B1 metallo-beta-lactamase [Bacillus]MDU0072795.1 subclass B1 metallo-beta-lactamase [Bacillus sp. IG6]MED8020588.1 subclass B1 metallo-beta-lactamase [Bacillus glycinifermentans]QAT65594.1 subclass B1 metallo-beta-lactamase [Bacillus glycinifermentans]WKB75288.1 subclass B1 metallo-beta-lactamase [Bacillus glycinifermentans]